MKGIVKRFCTVFLALATMLTALPTMEVHAAEKQYWTTGKGKGGRDWKGYEWRQYRLYIQWKLVRRWGRNRLLYRHQHGLYFWLQDQSRCKHTHECRQISDVALSLEYVKQYAKTHNNLNDKQAYLLEQCVVWQRLSVHLGWECDNVRASYDEIPKSVQDEVYTGAEAFVKANKGRYECGGYLRRVFR